MQFVIVMTDELKFPNITYPLMNWFEQHVQKVNESVRRGEWRKRLVETHSMTRQSPKSFSDIVSVALLKDDWDEKLQFANIQRI